MPIYKFRLFFPLLQYVRTYTIFTICEIGLFWVSKNIVEYETTSKVRIIVEKFNFLAIGDHNYSIPCQNSLFSLSKVCCQKYENEPQSVWYVSRKPRNSAVQHTAHEILDTLKGESRNSFHTFCSYIVLCGLIFSYRVCLSSIHLCFMWTYRGR